MPDYIYKITDLNGVDKADIRDKALTDLETAGNAGKVVTISGANTLSAVDILNSPNLTGTPTAPTATAGTNTTQIATTAFVQTELSSKAPLASPTFTGIPEAPTATAGTNTTQIATTQFVNSEIAKDAWLLTGGTAIPEGADLNNYTTTGNYSTTTTAIARNLYNAPWSYGSTSGGAFLLKVISPTYGGSNTNYVRQELYTLGTAVKKWGRRRGDNLTWGTWQRVASTDDLPRIITYGDSNETYSGIATEVAAGKIIFCHYSTASDDVTLPYVCTTNSTPPKHVFTNMVGNTRWTLYIDNTNAWSNSYAALVPDTRTINGHALSGSFSLTGTDINSGMSSLSGIDGVVLAEAIAPANAPVSPSSNKQIVWLRGNTPIT